MREEDLWQATLYVLGEGTDAERARFEDRMGFDETLRLAVAEATRLIELTTEGMSTSTSRSVMPAPLADAVPPRWHVRHKAAAVLGTAGALLFTIGLLSSSSTGSLSDAELVTQLLESSSDDEGQYVEAGTSEWTDELETPNWLMTAVELEEASGPTTESTPASDDSSI